MTLAHLVDYAHCNNVKASVQMMEVCRRHNATTAPPPAPPPLVATLTFNNQVQRLVRERQHPSFDNLVCFVCSFLVISSLLFTILLICFWYLIIYLFLLNLFSWGFSTSVDSKFFVENIFQTKWNCLLLFISNEWAELIYILLCMDITNFVSYLFIPNFLLNKVLKNWKSALVIRLLCQNWLYDCYTITVLIFCWTPLWFQIIISVHMSVKRFNKVHSLLGKSKPPLLVVSDIKPWGIDSLLFVLFVEGASDSVLFTLAYVHGVHILVTRLNPKDQEHGNYFDNRGHENYKYLWVCLCVFFKISTLHVYCRPFTLKKKNLGKSPKVTVGLYF